MKLNVEYTIITEEVSLENTRYLMKYKKEVKDIISYIITDELFKNYLKEDSNINIKDIKNGIRDINVSVSFVSEKKIQELNNQYRNINKITDVLSFPIQDPSEIKKIKSYINKEKKEENIKNQITIYSEILLGDIFICLPKIIEQAKEYGHTIERELMYMIVHGMYHLLGYDHIEESDKQIMRKREEKVLNKFKYGLDGNIK